MHTLPRKPSAKVKHTPCVKCGGTGINPEGNFYADRNGDPKWKTACTRCEGFGTICPTCHNTGFFKMDVMPGHPAFGKAQPCMAHGCKVYQRALAKSMASLSILPPDLEAIEASFATFPRSMDKRAIRVVQAYTQKIIDGKLGSLRGMIMRGVNQIGKTGLAYCTHKALGEANVASVFIPSIDLFQKLNAAQFDRNNPNRKEDLIDRLSRVTHLVIDDLGSENQSPSREQDLFQLLNVRTKTPGTATLITTNLDIDLDAPQMCALEAAIGKRCFARIAGTSFADLEVRGKKWALIRADADEMSAEGA